MNVQFDHVQCTIYFPQFDHVQCTIYFPFGMYVKNSSIAKLSNKL